MEECLPNDPGAHDESSSSSIVFADVSARDALKTDGSDNREEDINAELRHRALQWMIDPPHDGGLGLDIQTAAHIAGHHDGGYLVCSTYSNSPSTAPWPARGTPSTPTRNAHRTHHASSQDRPVA